MPSSRIAITGGHVLSMDPRIGELQRGDVLIEDGRIAAVEPDLGGSTPNASTPPARS